MEAEAKNAYLDQVLKEQAQVEQALRVQRVAPAAARSACAPGDDGSGFYQADPETPAGNGVPYRITGVWRWKNVVVPPNCYVVHTRRGCPDPLHCGLGISFRFDPWTDAFIVVPAAMQTILINARCISRERQGVLVQGYVQWIIEDFRTAYRKCDFTDALDPMRLANLQLREQAEAAIKDKVATMSIDEVLADKQPIIRELTERLRQVMEGGEGGDRGLGLRVVTVQIKEAIVSSPRVWEMLQRPFRAERAKEARIAELANEGVIAAKEAEAAKSNAKQKIESESEIARLRSAAEAQAFDRTQAEAARRAKVEAEALAQTIAHEKEKIAKKSEMAKLQIEQDLAREEIERVFNHRWAEKEIALAAARRKVDNDLSAAALQAKLVDRIPEIASKMPKPEHLKAVSFGDGADGGVRSLVAGLVELVAALKDTEPTKDGKK
jgi:regulator of protease activity HflC (stomatin/prohibitin superfamily)